MKYRTLGRTGLKVSLLGMGTGGHDPLGQKSGRSEAEMHRLLHRAFDFGINLFDSSPGYLESEVILGRALKSLPRDELVVSTKIPLAPARDGILIPMTADEVIDAVETSLRRLQLDVIDIMLLAVGGGAAFLEQVVHEHIPVLLKLKAQGKIRFIGSSEESRSDGAHEWLRRILTTDVIDVAMVAHNMINQSAQRLVFPLCKEKNIGVINIFTVRNLFWNPARLKEVIVDLKKRGVIATDAVPDDGALDWMPDGGDVGSLVEAAYRYVVHTEAVTTAMCGTLDIRELEEDVEFIRKGPLPVDKTQRLAMTFGHISEAVGN